MDNLVNHAPDFQTQAAMAEIKNCPNCGNQTINVGVEKVAVEASPLLVATIIALLVSTAYKLFIELQRPSRGYDWADTFHSVGVVVVAVVVVFAVLIWAIYNLRQRPCHVAHCSQCGYVEALDESPKWTKGWKLKGLPGVYFDGVWINAPGKLSNSQQPEASDDPSNPFRPA